LRGTLEDVPLPDAEVDVVISNCVINLSVDKLRVFAEAARVLKVGGRFAVTDVVADHEMAEAIRRDTAAWTGCLAGALTREEYLAGRKERALPGSRSSRPIVSTSTPARRSSARTSAQAGERSRSLRARRGRRASIAHV
jgi:SAM-dependent methyltransferase